MVQILKVSNAVLRFDLDIQREDVNSAYKERFELKSKIRCSCHAAV